ncbi:MAG: hypothetical protein ACR2IH_12180, partial [Pyrinomonadaceae bacterium]
VLTPVTTGNGGFTNRFGENNIYLRIGIGKFDFSVVSRDQQIRHDLEPDNGKLSLIAAFILAPLSESSWAANAASRSAAELH